jgi:hypothetical protein
MKPWLHARISEKKFGGVAADYIEIHEFIDSSKAAHADMRHRAILHSAFGIYITALVFGTMEQQKDGTWKRMPYIKNSDGELVQVRDIAEQHVLDDLGTIPSVGDWLKHMVLEPWMGGPIRKRKIGSLADFVLKPRDPGAELKEKILENPAYTDSDLRHSVVYDRPVAPEDVLD